MGSVLVKLFVLSILLCSLFSITSFAFSMPSQRDAPILTTVSTTSQIILANVTINSSEEQDGRMAPTEDEISESEISKSATDKISPVTSNGSVEIINEGIKDITVKIVCPENQTYSIKWPEEPYDFKEGDCAAISKEYKIDEYIYDLYLTAESCLDYTSAAIEEVHYQRDEIVAYLETLSRPFYPEGYVTSAKQTPEQVQPFRKCKSITTIYTDYAEIFPDDVPEGFEYTGVLKGMRRLAEKACGEARSLNKDLVCMCEDAADLLNGREGVKDHIKEDSIKYFENYKLDEKGIDLDVDKSLSWFISLNKTMRNESRPTLADCPVGSLLLTTDVESMILQEIGGETLEFGSVIPDGEQSYSVEVEKEVKLLGFIPKRMKINVGVDADTGNITAVRYPWWAFLAAK